MLQDLYSVSCLSWVLVTLCLLQPGLEAFVIIHLLCYSLCVSAFHVLQGEEEEAEGKDEQRNCSSTKEHSSVSTSSQRGADMRETDLVMLRQGLTSAEQSQTQTLLPNKCLCLMLSQLLRKGTLAEPLKPGRFMTFSRITYSFDSKYILWL